jgi:Trypsin-like peptidase domain
MNKYTSLLLSFMISTTLFAQSDPNIIDEPALNGTLQIKYNGGTATAFQYKGIDSNGYIITAKHVFAVRYKKKAGQSKDGKYIYYDSIPNSDGDKVDVQIYYAGNWVNIDAILHFDNGKDDIPMEGNNYNIGHYRYYLSQDCFFVGFPLGLRQNIGVRLYPFPFVRKGIISAFGDTSAGAVVRIYIDGHNTYGFSGGPVLCYDYDKKIYVVIGVISGYIPQQNIHYNEDGIKEITEENSGLMEVDNIEFAIRILKRLKAM